MESLFILITHDLLTSLANVGLCLPIQQSSPRTKYHRASPQTIIHPIRLFSPSSQGHLESTDRIQSSVNPGALHLLCSTFRGFFNPAKFGPWTSHRRRQLLGSYGQTNLHNACKLLKRRCSPNCIFAPYFRSDEPRKFAKVHKVFGASNVSKILTEVPEERREDTVNSLAYEAEARLRDPVYGCIGAIALLQRKMIQLQNDLAFARARLAWYAATCSAISISDFPAGSGGFIDSFSQNISSELNQDAHMYDFSQISYI
ncbi:hypothetical protein PTKIN_Ptkin01aG0143200 [Pterospermum kingtungense]